jgi:hypothetical protein
MKPDTQLQKIISILMAFILMIELTGCYSIRILTASEINQSDYYLIHGKESVYLSYNDTISDGILSGKLDFNNKKFNDPRISHIYVSSDSLLTISNDRISLPVNSIEKIKQRVPEPGKTRTLKTLLIIGAAAGSTTLGIIAAVRLFNEAEQCGNDIFYCDERGL